MAAARHMPSALFEYELSANRTGAEAMSDKKRLLTTAAAFSVVALALSLWLAYRLWPRTLPIATPLPQVSPSLHGGRLVVPFASAIVAAEVATFRDQLEAFLQFEYLRGRDTYDAPHMFLTASRTDHGRTYKICIVIDNDQLVAIPRLSQLESNGFFEHFEFVTWTKNDLAFYRQQSRLFEYAYNMSTEQKLESLPSFQLLPALADFLVFKSQTDWRVVSRRERAPRPLTRDQATLLASDILSVAKFYSLPLDYFLGVGAMENNYMDVDGDLTHAVWKRRADHGDFILERGRKRVLVSDYSIGTWQISRETLRRAHQLYLKDKRHYELLPARLRPPREFDVNSVDSALLTTYAGLLLRDLLDRFDCNVDKAIGAYNGGVRNPNPSYASSVRTVALYARRVIGQAALAGPQAVDGTALTDEPFRSYGGTEIPPSTMLEP
jgi:hypothetical protein